MEWLVIQFGFSLVAIGALVALAHWLGFSQPAKLENENEACEIFRLTVGGFEPVEIAIDTEGRTAIARNRQGQLAVLVPHGNRFVARRLSEDAKIAVKDTAIAISAPSLGSAKLTLHSHSRIVDWFDPGPNGS